MFVRGEIESLALSLGIDACGVAAADSFPDDALYLREWTSEGYHGSMEYMARHIDLRGDIRQLVPEAKSVVVCLFNYYKAARQTTDAPRIAQCGLSREDYHIVVKRKLEELENALCVAHPDCVDGTHQHIFCDSAPVLERRWAERVGLGWIGKNHLLIHPTLGSFVHIGVLVLQEEVAPLTPPYKGEEAKRGAGGCGDCTLCLQVCPTGAIRGEHFDARKCVSYLTIERKAPLPPEGGGVRALLKGVLYGCDRCQDVCPYNQHLQETKHTAFQANEQLLTMTAADWKGMSRRQKVRLLRRLAKE